jgi:hypothetical protein
VHILLVSLEWCRLTSGSRHQKSERDFFAVICTGDTHPCHRGQVGQVWEKNKNVVLTGFLLARFSVHLRHMLVRQAQAERSSLDWRLTRAFEGVWVSTFCLDLLDETTCHGDKGLAAAMSSRIVLHPRAAPSDSLRFWLGILEQAVNPKLTWYLDGAVTEPTPVRNLGRSYPYPEPGYTGVMTGVYEFSGLDPGTIHRVQVEIGDTEYSDVLQARTLPAELGNEPFRVLLASCFDYETDPTGLAGQLVAGLKPPPDLTLLVGDQVYLDLPLRLLIGSEPTLARQFEGKYLANWTIPVGRGTTGYARILDVAPTTCVPDDHEFWNNFPQPSLVAPMTFTPGARRSWTNAALAMYRAFQQNEATPTSEIIEINPLSFFLMDNRTGRSEDFTHTVSGETLNAFEDLDQRCCWYSHDPRAYHGPIDLPR